MTLLLTSQQWQEADEDLNTFSRIFDSAFLAAHSELPMQCQYSGKLSCFLRSGHG